MVDSRPGGFLASSATRWQFADVHLPQNDGRLSRYTTSLRMYMTGHLVAPRRGGRLGRLLPMFAGVLRPKKKTVLRLQHPHNCNAKTCSACFRFVSAPRSRQEARADGTARIGNGMAPGGTGTPANNRPPRTGCGNRARTVVETTTEASRARGRTTDSLLLLTSLYVLLHLLLACTTDSLLLLTSAACLHCTCFQLATKRAYA